MDDFLTEKQIERINRIRAERAIKKVMAPEPPTTRFGEPIKRSAAESVFTNPDLLKQIGAFTNPKYPEMPDLDDGIEKYNNLLNRYRDMMNEYENPQKQRQTARVKKERDEQKERLRYWLGNLRMKFNELIEQPIQSYLAKLWRFKYGGNPGSIADKSKMDLKEIDKIFEEQANDLFKEYSIEPPP
jgi:type VI protein secretion system component VasK